MASSDAEMDFKRIIIVISKRFGFFRRLKHSLKIALLFMGCKVTSFSAETDIEINIFQNISGSEALRNVS